MTCLLCPKNSGGLFPEKLGGGVRYASWNPYPISDQNLRFSLPYFRPEALELGAWPKRVTSCYGVYTVVGVNIKREMVLLPNDEKVANSSKKHTQFKTRVHKPYPISDQNAKKNIPFGAVHTYIASIRDYPPPPPRGEKRVADYESRCLRKRDLQILHWVDSHILCRPKK